MKKLAVQFSKSPITRYVLDRLKVCKKCGSYSVLPASQCPVCQTQAGHMPFRSYSNILCSRKFQIEALFCLTVCIVAVIAAGNPLQLIAAFAALIGIVAFLLFIRRYYRERMQLLHLESLVKSQLEKIRTGLARDTESAVLDAKEDKYKSAYEKLREIGHFLHNDQIKRRKIVYLNHFMLRRDMELELETLIPSDYDQDFIIYLGEIVKVNRQLIKKTTLDYVTTYKKEILQLEHGADIIAGVAGAALRIKPYVHQYMDLIVGSLDVLPKERLLRLCQLLSSREPNEWQELYQQTKNIVRKKYDFDPDFKGVI